MAPSLGGRIATYSRSIRNAGLFQTHYRAFELPRAFTRGEDDEVDSAGARVRWHSPSVTLHRQNFGLMEEPTLQGRAGRRSAESAS